MELENKELEIDLLALFNYLKKKLVYVAIAAVVGALVGMLYTGFFTTPYYTASTRMYVLNRESDKAISTSDISISNYVVKDYKVLITGKNVTQEVVNRLGLNMSYGQVAGKVTVTAIDSTRILQIDVVDTDPQRAADIANAIREVSSQQLKAIMDVDAVNVVYEAEAPHNPTGPSTSKNMILAAIAAAALAVVVFVVIFLLDDTIRTEEDVERLLGLGTLGVIPMSKELGTEAANSKRGLFKLKQSAASPRKAKK